MRKFALAAIIALIAFGMGSSGALAANGDAVEDGLETSQIDECTVINESGKYQLTTDVEGNEGACLVISDTRDVKLNGNGNTILASRHGLEIIDSSNVTIENLNVRGAAEHGIVIVHSARVAVRNSSIEETGEEGLWSRNSKHVEFSYNSVKNSTKRPAISTSSSAYIEIKSNEIIQTKHIGLVSESSTHVRVFNNTVINVGENPDEHEPYNGMQVFESSNVTIGQNYFEGHIYGIQISEQSTGIFVLDNEIRNSTLCAADVKDSENVIFDGNHLIDHAGIDIERNASDVIVRNNVVRSSRSFGIGVKKRSSNVTLYNNTITNNNLSGIWVAFEPTNIRIRENIIRDNGNWGIRVDAGVSNLSVSNNRIEKNGKDGSRIIESHHITYNDNLIRANGQNISVQYVSAGIRVVENSHNIKIRQNHFADNGHGVWADESTASVNATLNWWGSETGPSGHGPGKGDAVSKHVRYEPWLTSELYISMTSNREDEPAEITQPGFHFVVGIFAILLIILLGLWEQG